MIQRILHVDDDQDIRTITRMALEEIGAFDLCQCASGAEALEKAPAFAPDFIILDVMMPDLSGEETLALLKGNESLRNTPFIFMTAKGSASVRDHLLSLGASEVIVKPFDPVTLAEDVRSIWQEATAA